MAGLYTVLEQVGNAFRIDLPPLIRIHPVISANKCDRTSWAKAQELKSSIFENLKLRS